MAKFGPFDLSHLDSYMSAYHELSDQATAVRKDFLHHGHHRDHGHALANLKSSYLLLILAKPK